MARIILEESETFSHSHDDSNFTCCLQGKIEIEIEGNSRMLNPGEKVSVSGGVKHILRNIGTGPAMIECAHAPEPDDTPLVPANSARA